MTTILKFITSLAWWIQPTIIALLLSMVLGQQVRVSNAKVRALEAQASYKELAVNVTKQNEAATAKLATLTSQAKNLQTNLNMDAQERAKNDVRNQQTISGLQGSLRTALARPSRLCGTSKGDSGAGDRSTSSSPTAYPTSSGRDSAETSRVLLPNAAESLERLTTEADAINVAYASCKADLEAAHKAVTSH